MAIEKIKMPQLGESVTEGTITKWFINVGDTVNEYEPLAEVMTDKVTAEIPSLFSGVIKEIGPENETFAVGEIICTLETAEIAEKKEAPAQKSEVKPANPVNVQVQQGKARFSPAVLKLSQEHGIELNKLVGTGADGRITRKDVLHYIESGEDEKVIEAETIRVVPDEAPVADATEPQQHRLGFAGMIKGDTEIPVTAVRKVIANNMVKSKHEIPHGWLMVEVDVTNLVNYRDAIKEEFKKKEGYNITYFAFVVKAVAQALREYPQLNSAWAGDKIVQKQDINLSIAVATDNALFVPVIKNADEKSVKGIAREVAVLAEKVRTSKLTQGDVQGGTFTVNNTGSFGSIQSQGIINYPQAAILQVEAIVKRPVVIDNMIAIRDMINLCLSLDHRILDGLICGKFMNKVKEILEKTSKEHTPIY